MTNKITKLIQNWEEYLLREYVEPGWQPDPNRTIFYFDFENNLNDSSWNNVQIIASGNITYEAVWWQSVIKSTWNNPYLQLPTTIGNNLTDFTVSFWLYPIIWTWQNYVMLFWDYAYNWSDWVWPHVFYYDDGHFTVRVNNRNEQNVWNLTQNVWQHIVFTRSSWTCTAYLNWQQTWSSFTDTTQWDLTTGQYSDFYIFSRNGSQNWKWSWQKWDKYIFENVGWSAQEVQDYFNQTKSLYGIS